MQVPSLLEMSLPQLGLRWSWMQSSDKTQQLSDMMNRSPLHMAGLGLAWGRVCGPSWCHLFGIRYFHTGAYPRVSSQGLFVSVCWYTIPIVDYIPVLVAFGSILLPSQDLL